MDFDVYIDPQPQTNFSIKLFHLPKLLEFTFLGT